MTNREAAASLLRFLVVGGTAVLVDAAAYAAFVWAGTPVDPAKALGFAVGAVFAYVANWRFTFGARRSRWSELLFVLVYAVALGLNVTANAAIRGWLGDDGTGTTLAFLGATALSAAWNFVGMSLFVFRRKEPVLERAER
ncbi:GtrA family protein [Blastococcus sp. SYSU D00669]